MINIAGYIYRFLLNSIENRRGLQVTRICLSGNTSRRIREKLVKDSLEIILLTLLEEQPRTGYDLIASIFSSSDVLLSPGTVYPLLKSLEKHAFIESASVGKARTFTLTRSGKSFLTRVSGEYNEAQRLVSRIVGSKPKEKAVDFRRGYRCASIPGGAEKTEATSRPT